MGLMVGGSVNWQIVVGDFLKGLRCKDDENRWLKVKGARDMLCTMQQQYSDADVRAALTMLWNELTRLEAVIPISVERRKELIGRIY